MSADLDQLRRKWSLSRKWRFSFTSAIAANAHQNALKQRFMNLNKQNSSFSGTLSHDFSCISADSCKFYWVVQKEIWGRDPFNQNSDRSDREKRTTSKGGPVFSKLFRWDRTDALSFGPKFPEILVEWITPWDFLWTFTNRKLPR